MSQDLAHNITACEAIPRSYRAHSKYYATSPKRLVGVGWLRRALNRCPFRAT
jgi:hypothetical protein